MAISLYILEDLVVSVFPIIQIIVKVVILIRIIWWEEDGSHTRRLEGEKLRRLLWFSFQFWERPVGKNVIDHVSDSPKIKHRPTLFGKICFGSEASEDDCRCHQHMIRLGCASSWCLNGPVRN